MKKAAILLLCQLVLCNCSATESEPTTGPAVRAQTFVYECPGDFSFVARIEADRAWLFLPGRTVKLPQVPSASGAQYSNGRETYWNRNGEATLESDDGRYPDCKNNYAKAIWEHAKLNGVDFRATGNEPGWYLEISEVSNILLVSDYGQRRYRFESAAIEPRPNDRTTVYHASNDHGDLLEVVITGTACRDSMSGEQFAASVSVVVNDKQLTGCGKALH